MKDFLKKAKAIITNYRYWVLFIVMGLCVVFTMLDVNEDVTGVVFVYLIVSSKLLAVGFGYLYYRLYTRWEAKGTIPELVNSINNF